MLHCLESAATNCCGACIEARVIADIVPASGDAADVWEAEEVKMGLGVVSKILLRDWSTMKVYGLTGQY